METIPMTRELPSFRLDETGYSPAFFMSEISTSTCDHVEALERIVRKTHRSARLCMFADASAPLHAMIIAQPRGMDSLPRLLANKPKLFMPLRGRIVLMKLNTEGDVEKRAVLQPGRDILSYVEPGVAYIDLPVEEVTVHLEITLGPHDRVGDRNFPRFRWDSGVEARNVWRNEQMRFALETDSGSA